MDTEKIKGQIISFTKYHAKYFAHQLTKKCASNNLEKFATTLLDAQVDLNPHQIDAALFAFKSPLSKGAILADEVGLGKTIEAGLLISQKCAEKKKKNFNPFNQDSIVISSYQFIKTKDAYVQAMKWDLVVIDEAHRLRNVYLPKNKTANAIRKYLMNLK